MSRRRKKAAPASRAPLLLLMVVLVLGGGYYLYLHPEVLQRIGLKRDGPSPSARNQHGSLQSAGEKLRREGSVPAQIYFLSITNGRQRLLPTERRAAADHPARSALEELLRGPLPAGCARPLPAGVRLLGIDVSDGVARVDFSRELVANFRGGSDNEGAAVYAIVNTLTSLRGIERVAILVEGRRIDSIGGHLLINGPLAFDGELVVAQ